MRDVSRILRTEKVWVYLLFAKDCTAMCALAAKLSLLHRIFSQSLQSLTNTPLHSPTLIHWNYLVLRSTLKAHAYTCTLVRLLV